MPRNYISPSEDTLHIVRRLRGRLKTTIRCIVLADILYGLTVTLGVTAALFLGFLAIEAGFWMNTLPRSIAFWAFLTGIGGLVSYFLLRPLLRFVEVLPGPSEEAIARQIGRRYTEVSDRLVNLLHLAEGRGSMSPPPLVDEAVRTLGEQIKSVPFERMEDFGRTKRVSPLALLPVAGLLFFLLAAPTTFLDASQRLLSPGTTFHRPAPFVLKVSPGSTELLRGETLNLTVRASGTDLPQTALLVLNHADEDHEEEIPLTLREDGLFGHYMANIRKDLRYRVVAGPVTTEWFTVRVHDRPIVRNLQITLSPPSYTGQSAQNLSPNVGDIAALPGTRVAVSILTGGGPIIDAHLLFDNNQESALATGEGNIATGSFTMHREGSYQILLKNNQGTENADPIRYSLHLLTDAPPSIILLEPSPDADMDTSLEAILRLRITDDFGFHRLSLHYRLSESRFNEVSPSFETLPLSLQWPHQVDQEVEHLWLLGTTTQIDIVPGDVIEYFVQVWDNDTTAGHKPARSSVHRLRMPSLAERYATLSETQEESEDEMEALLEETQTIREQFEELRDALREKRAAGWEEDRQLESIIRQQGQMEERIDDLAADMETATEQMEDHALASEETLDMFQEMQRVMEEINSPELMEALRELQEAMEEIGPRPMQEAMEKFSFNEKQFRERMERALELFRNLQVQQQLEEAARRAEELAERQEKLAEKTAQAQSSEEQAEKLAQEQLQSKEEMEQLEEHMNDIEERMEELQNAPEEQMEQLNEQTQQQQLPENMQQNAQQLQQQRMQQAQQGQQQMQQQLQQMQGQLQDMQMGMQGQQSRVNMLLLRHILANLLSLSHDQEALRKDVDAAVADTPLMRGFTRRQLSLSDGLRTLSDSLQSLARQVPQVGREVQRQTGEALLSMEQATRTLVERIRNQAVHEQQRSMTHLNELALLLSDLMDQLLNAPSSNSSGGMSMDQMIQQLQQMAGQQQQLNQEIQEMLQQMQGQRLTPNMEARMRQMGEQQQMLRHQLREMSRQRKLASQLTGDLNKIAEQMEETIKEFMGGSLNQRTQQRQQQILTRLLDASRSLNERGRQRKRENRSGENVVRQSPDAVTPHEQTKQMRRALLKALEGGYSADYQELIKRYFELLQKEE